MYSGCSVYGRQAPLLLKEDLVYLDLDTPNQMTKVLGERYCDFFHNFDGLPAAIARYFSVYGPGELPGTYRNVIPQFIYWAGTESLPVQQESTRRLETSPLRKT